MFRLTRLRHALKSNSTWGRSISFSSRTGHTRSVAGPALAVGIGFAVGASCLSGYYRLYADTDSESNGSRDHASPANLPSTFSQSGSYEVVDPGSYLRRRILSVDSWPELGVRLTEVFCLASNYPCEDVSSSARTELIATGQAWAFWGIFDGHNGAATSAHLAEILAIAVTGALGDLYSTYAKFEAEEPASVDAEPLRSAISGPVHPPAEEVDKAIKETFLRVDDDIVHWAAQRALAKPLQGATMELLQPALAGSCALLGFFDSDSRELRMALTGDSRAVLARPVRDAKGRTHWQVHALSQDQNAHNEAEMARMEGEHPGETIGANGRVLGWGMARAFGDAAYKWSRELQTRLYEGYLCDYPRSNVKTPPYFTAEPEITTTVVRPGDVLVMASDGLWDCLTNEEVVGLVGIWMEKNNNGKESASLFQTSNSSFVTPRELDIIDREALPVDMKPDHTKMYAWWHSEKRFVNLDDTMAAHLARNALGGANIDLTSALLTLEPPRARRYRDDISIQVVVFD